MVSGTFSLRCERCFSPFPHGTGSLSVSREYLALADGPAGFAQGSTCPALLRVPLRFSRLRVRAFHPLRGRFPTASARRPSSDNAALQPPPGRDRAGLGWSPFARRYLGNHSCFLFLRVLRCFSSPRWPPGYTGMADLPSAGLSHSGTRGSTAVCASPRIFAAYRALRRLREPRHPPCALACLPSRPPAHRCAGGGVCRKPSRAPETSRDGRIIWNMLPRGAAARRADSLASVVLLSNMPNTDFRENPEKVENNGFEPLTLCLQSRCSSQLS